MNDANHDKEIKPFHLSVAQGIRQVQGNHTYGHVSEIKNIDDLRQAVQFDHIAGIFKDNHRSIQNFIEADAIIMDCDNDRSDNPNDWLTPVKLSQQLQDVMFYTVYSRNHMKDKYDDNGKLSKSARPRFHVYFPLSITYRDADAVRSLKEHLLQAVQDFDAGAKDAARLFFGVDKPECIYHYGHVWIDDFMNAYEDTENEAVDDDIPVDDVIREGSRDNTLFQNALSYLSLFGEKKAYRLFKEDCSRCQPHLPVSQCNKIWKKTTGYARNFKDKCTPRKANLTLRIIEQTLQEFDIDIRLDVITRRVSISDLPPDNPFVPDSYYASDDITRRNANSDFLPLFLASYLRDKNYAVSDAFIRDALEALTKTHKFNPFWDMIMHTTCEKPYDRILEVMNALGISENSCYAGFFEKWLHQVVAMALNDDGSLGNEFVLVLQGKQGIGKTSFFRKLAVYPDWFREGANIDMQNKDSIMEATNVLIAELGELEATINRQQPSLKAFLTRTFDTFRAPYAHYASSHERRVTFCATVNNEQFLRDETGSRRFVVIPVAEIDKRFIHEHMTHEYVCKLWRGVYDILYLQRGKNGFRLTDEEMTDITATNARDFTKHVKGENELYDLLDWDNPSGWTFYTATEISRLLDIDRKYSAQEIGKALSAISKRDSRVERKTTMYGTKYFLPQKKGLYS